MDQNMLYLIVRTQGGENLDPLPFINYSTAYAKLKELYEAEVNADPEYTVGEFYDQAETNLLDWGFTVAYYEGWLKANIMQVPNPGVLVALPDGRSLHAVSKDDPDYPCIKICVLDKDMKPDDGGAGAVWMEYDQASEDVADNQRLRILAWNANSANKYNDEGEPVLKLRYDTGEVLEN
jgi:hypothetical protein